MNYISPDYGIPVIDDDTILPPADPSVGRGLIPRPWRAAPYGMTPYCGPFDMPLIPRSEWTERIRDMEETKSSLHHLCQSAKYRIKHQSNTNYCWINGPVMGMEVVRIVQGQPYVSLSPASVGAKIKNFRNVGGWGTEGLEYLVKYGCVPSSLWPDNAISRDYDTPAANAARAGYQVDEWYDLRPRVFDQLATCLLNRVPVTTGHNWMSHQVLCVALLKADGADRYNVLTYNSGYLRDNNGMTILSESKANPDDAVAPRTATAS